MKIEKVHNHLDCGPALFLTPYGETDHFGMRQAPECLDSVHISARLWELLKAENQCFYMCSPFAGICPPVFLPITRRAGGRPSSRPPLLCSIGLRPRSRPSISLTWSVSWSVTDQMDTKLPSMPIECGFASSTRSV